ncbi:RsmD family RNA methyltransferase, partial [Pasteurella multocida]
MQKSTALKGEVRIIAGLWRGRKLPVLSSEGLRPTGDRVKETLFNWLMP